jgi:hypothetical protein
LLHSKEDSHMTQDIMQTINLLNTNARQLSFYTAPQSPCLEPRHLCRTHPSTESDWKSIHISAAILSSWEINKWYKIEADSLDQILIKYRATDNNSLSDVRQSDWHPVSFIQEVTTVFPLPATSQTSATRSSSKSRCVKHVQSDQYIQRLHPALEPGSSWKLSMA